MKDYHLSYDFTCFLSGDFCEELFFKYIKRVI